MYICTVVFISHERRAPLGALMHRTLAAANHNLCFLTGVHKIYKIYYYHPGFLSSRYLPLRLRCNFLAECSCTIIEFIFSIFIIYLLPALSFLPFTGFLFRPCSFISPITEIEVIIIHHGARGRNHVERSTLHAGDILLGCPLPKGGDGAGQAGYVACRTRSGTKRTQLYSTLLSPFQITKATKRNEETKNDTPCRETFGFFPFLGLQLCLCALGKQFSCKSK